jgi:quercetin dioxygenase-like cupin family protein
MTSNVPTPLDFTSLRLQPFDAGTLADELLRSAGAARDGRSSRTLAKSKALTVVLTVLRAGHSLEEHAASGPVTVVVLRGAVTFTSPDAELKATVSPGQILMLGIGERHTVHATEDAGFLILIGSRS